MFKLPRSLLAHVGGMMAVYTEVGDNELEAFLAQYDIGEADSCKGIAEGVENRIPAADERGKFILTLYEKRVSTRPTCRSSSA